MEALQILNKFNINTNTEDKLIKLRAVADEIIKGHKFGQDFAKVERGYVDGGFDLLHSGHYNAIRQASLLCDVLVAGPNSDEELLANKGPTILNIHERAEILKHCKFVDEVAIGTPYRPDKALLDSINCSFYAHGDDPTFDHNGVDITDELNKLGMFKMFKRTEGVSTTDITGKLLALSEWKLNQEKLEKEKQLKLK